MMADRQSAELQEVRNSCAYLFAPEQVRSDGFIENLTIDMLKKAYRDNARLYHPDMHPDASREEMKENFIRVQEAYESILTYLERGIMPVPGTARPGKKLIAVGGAKGGIGKSIFAANLGILLSSMGHKVVIVDLDLGGSNLHLYLGSRAILKKTINDFIKKRIGSLQEAVTESTYGPSIIGGDGSEFGIANIDFARKVKVIKAIRTIDADFVIIDLGGDTTNNTIDFFLAADYGIVMTTRESAAYVEAYHFIKAALYRKLMRIFGPESVFSDKRDSDLELFISQNLLSPGDRREGTIGALMEKIFREQRIHFPFVQKVLSGYKPLLVVNKVPYGPRSHIEARHVAEKIRGVSRKWLSREIPLLGFMTYDQDTEASAVDLVPVVVKHPQGKAARELGLIIDRMFSDVFR